MSNTTTTFAFKWNWSPE